MDNLDISVRRSCSLLSLGPSLYYYKPRGRRTSLCAAASVEIAITQVRYGYWRIYILLRRMGWMDNHKWVHRVYREEGLNLRSKRPRRVRSASHRLERPVGAGLHQVWSMDFVSDAIFDGSRFRALTIVDDCSRE